MTDLEELESLDPRTVGYTARIETPTPHKVAVLTLVKQYITVKKVASDAGLMFALPSRRNFCMLLLKLIQYPDMTYNDLHQLLTSARYKIDPVHLEAFEKSMSDLFSSGIEVIFDFAELQNIEKMLAEELGVSQFSIVGMYIRRVGVVLERLSFPEMMALYKNICMYYEKGIRSLTIGPRRVAASTGYLQYSDITDSELTFDLTEDSLEESALDTDTVHQDRNPHSKWSPKQAELFVAQQSTLLEFNELRALRPIEMQVKINEIINDNPLSSQAYFLSYMNQLRVRDYFSSVDAMHRSFDRSPMQMMQQTENKGFQYFCVNLAVLHATFNHKREALSALKECVMLAQECGDKRCLDLANSWYCTLNSSKIDPFENTFPDESDPCLQQSLAQAIQFVVKFGAQCCFQPLDLFELLCKTDELSTKHNKMEYISDSMALRSALWCLYGRHNLSSLFAQLLLNLKKTWAFGDVGNCESVAKVLANQALWYYFQGDQQLSAVLLQHARERFPRQPLASNWLVSECVINIQEAMYRCSWQEALSACFELNLIDPVVGRLHTATVYIAKRYFSIARSILDKLLKNPELDVLTRVKSLHLMACCAMNEQCLSSQTIDLLIQASTIATSAHMEYEHAIIDLTLADVFLRLNMPGRAFKMVRTCMQKIYINGSVYDRAKTDFTFVRCLFAEASSKEDKQKAFPRALKLMDSAVNNLKLLEAHSKVLDILAFVAKTCDELEDHDQRNKYACHFKQYHMEHPIAVEYLDMIS